MDSGREAENRKQAASRRRGPQSKRSPSREIGAGPSIRGAAVFNGRPRSGPGNGDRDRHERGGARAAAETTHLDRVRRQFFAHAGDLATRYRLTLADVLAHVETARGFLPGRVAAGPIWIEDLVLAAACTRGVAIAWVDLTTHLEPSMRRAAASRLSEADAAIFVARFSRSLRRSSSGAASTDRRGGAPSLREFAGQRSLASWLAERLLAQLDWATPAAATPAGDAALDALGSGT